MHFKLQSSILAFVFSFSFSNLYAQEVSLEVKHKFNLPESSIYVDKVLYADDEEILIDNTQRKYKGQNLDINLMQIVRLDKQFKQTGLINLEEKFKDWNLGNDFFDNYQDFSTFTGAAKGATVKDGYLVLLYNENEKNENKYAVAKVDKNLNTSEAKTFLTISKKDLSKYNMLRTFVSPDLSKVAIIAERNYDGKKQDLYYPGKDIWGLQKKVYITVLDNNGNKIWSNSFNLEINDEGRTQIRNMAVSNNGSVMLNGKIITNKSADNKYGFLYTIDANGNNLKSINIPQFYIELPVSKTNEIDISNVLGINNANITALNNPNLFAFVTSVNDANNLPESIKTIFVNGNGEIINTLTQAIPQEYKTALSTAKANTENSFASYLSIAKIFTDKNDDLTILMDGINILQYKYKYIGAYAGNYTDYLGNSVFFALAKTDNKSISLSPVANHNFLAPLYSKKTNIFEQPYYHFYNNKVYVFKKAGIIDEDSKYTMPTVKKNTLKTPKTDHEALFLDVIDINGNHKNSKLADFINSETRIDIYSGYMSRLSDDKIIYFETNGKGRRGSFLAYNESLGIMTIK